MRTLALSFRYARNSSDLRTGRLKVLKYLLDRTYLRDIGTYSITRIIPSPRWVHKRLCTQIRRVPRCLTDNASVFSRCTPAQHFWSCSRSVRTYVATLNRHHKQHSVTHIVQIGCQGGTTWCTCEGAFRRRCARQPLHWGHFGSALWVSLSK